MLCPPPALDKSDFRKPSIPLWQVPPHGIPQLPRVRVSRAARGSQGGAALALALPSPPLSPPPLETRSSGVCARSTDQLQPPPPPLPASRDSCFGCGVLGLGARDRGAGGGWRARVYVFLGGGGGATDGWDSRARAQKTEEGAPAPQPVRSLGWQTQAPPLPPLFVEFETKSEYACTYLCVSFGPAARAQHFIFI